MTEVFLLSFFELVVDPPYVNKDFNEVESIFEGGKYEVDRAYKEPEGQEEEKLFEHADLNDVVDDFEIDKGDEEEFVEHECEQVEEVLEPIVSLAIEVTGRAHKTRLKHEG